MVRIIELMALLGFWGKPKESGNEQVESSLCRIL